MGADGGRRDQAVSSKSAIVVNSFVATSNGAIPLLSNIFKLCKCPGMDFGLALAANTGINRLDELSSRV